MRIGIGIDTGGTSTDAVLIDLDTRAILDTSKALTTHYDLMAGILNALDGLDPELCRKAELAGLSTTLATNACVESKARKSRLLLLGIDHQGIARNGARFGLNDPDDIRYLPCRTTIRGEVLEEPDWSVLRQHAREWFSDVEAVAVCEIFAVRNEGVVEKKAAQIIEEARARGQQEYDRLVAEAQTAVQRLDEQAARRRDSERTQMLREAKKEIAALVLLTTAKVSRQKLNSDTDRDMIDDFLREETEAAR